MRVLLLGSGRSSHLADRTALQLAFNRPGCEIVVMENVPNLEGESTHDKFERLIDSPVDLVCFVIHSDAKAGGFHYEAALLRKKLGHVQYVDSTMFFLHGDLNQDAILSQYLKDDMESLRVALFDNQDDLIRVFGNEILNRGLRGET